MQKKRKTGRRRWYTVILLYPDYLTDDFGEDLFVDFALAEDPTTAAMAVQKKARDAQNKGECDVVDDADDFKVIGIQLGKHPFVEDAYSYCPTESP